MCQTRETQPTLQQIEKEIACLTECAREINDVRSKYTRCRCKGVKSVRSLVMHSINDVLVEIGARLRELEAAKK